MITVFDSTSAPTDISASLPFEFGALAVDSVSAATHVSNGLNYTANQRLAVSYNAVISRIVGGIPLTSDGRLCMSVNAPAYASNGAAFTAEGWISVEQFVWSAAELAPAMWLDASDATTITSVGAAVSQWDDKSGNGNHASQAVGVNQPSTGIDTVNGLNVLTFDGVASYLVSLGVRATQPNTTILVAGTTNTTPSQQPIIDGYPEGINRQLALTGSSNTLLGINSGAWIYSTATEDAVPHTFILSYAGAASGIVADGATVATGDAGTRDLSGGMIIGTGFNLNKFYEGPIAEIVVVDRALTAAEYSQVAVSMAAKWGTPAP